MNKTLIILFILFSNINSFSKEKPVKDIRILYLVQEVKKGVVSKIRSSNIKNKERILTNLQDIQIIYSDTSKNHITKMQVSVNTKTYTKNNKIVKTDRIWSDKKILLGRDAFLVYDSQLSHAIKYQFTIFTLYFYLNKTPSNNKPLDKNKDFLYISNILNFNINYTPEVKEFKNETPLEDPRALYFFKENYQNIVSNIISSNIKNKKELLSELSTIHPYLVKDIDTFYTDIRMNQNTYKNNNSTQKKWVDKRMIFAPKALDLNKQSLQHSIQLQFSKFLYYFYTNRVYHSKFDENIYKYLCDLIDFNINYKYIAPSYPGETIVEDYRVLTYLDSVSKEVSKKVLESNLKNKEKLIEQLKDIKVYKAKDKENKVAEMVMRKTFYSGTSSDGKKAFKTYFWEEKRIRFRENALELSDLALKNTIKHELAHALVSFYYSYAPKKHHGEEFQYMCEIIDLDPKYRQAVVPMTHNDLY